MAPHSAPLRSLSLCALLNRLPPLPTVGGDAGIELDRCIPTSTLPPVAQLFLLFRITVARWPILLSLCRCQGCCCLRRRLGSPSLPLGDHPTDLSRQHDPRGFHSLQSAMASLNFCCCTASKLRLRSLSDIIFMGFCDSRCSMLEIVSGNGQFRIGMVSRANH